MLKNGQREVLNAFPLLPLPSACYKRLGNMKHSWYGNLLSEKWAPHKNRQAIYFLKWVKGKNNQKVGVVKIQTIPQQFCPSHHSLSKSNFDNRFIWILGYFLSHHNLLLSFLGFVSTWPLFCLNLHSLFFLGVFFIHTFKLKRRSKTLLYSFSIKTQF